MIGRFGSTRDPFEGRAAIRTRRRVRVEGFMALGLAIGACGLNLAMWLRTLAEMGAPLSLR